MMRVQLNKFKDEFTNGSAAIRAGINLSGALQPHPAFRTKPAAALFIKHVFLGEPEIKFVDFPEPLLQVLAELHVAARALQLTISRHCE